MLGASMEPFEGFESSLEEYFEKPKAPNGHAASSASPWHPALGEPAPETEGKAECTSHGLVELFARFTKKYYQVAAAELQSSVPDELQYLSDVFPTIKVLGQLKEADDLPLNFTWVTTLMWRVDDFEFLCDFLKMFSLKRYQSFSPRSWSNSQEEVAALNLLQASTQDLIQQIYRLDSDARAVLQCSALTAWLFVLITQYLVQEQLLDLNATLSTRAPQPEPPSLNDSFEDEGDPDNPHCPEDFVFVKRRLTYKGSHSGASSAGCKASTQTQVEDPLSRTPKSYQSALKCSESWELLPAF